MKKMLILIRGAGSNFNDLHGQSILRDLPFPVVLFVDKASAAVFSDLGEHIEVQTVRWSNADDVVARARQLHDGHGLFAVTTLDEHLVDLAAVVRAKLGVAGMSEEVTSRFRNKILMKQLLGAAGVRVPEHARCSDRAAVEHLLAKYHKMVAKPVDGLGSREVAFIHSRTELDAWYQEQGEEGLDGYEAEEYIDGVLYHVNAVVRDGKAMLTGSAIYMPGMANIDFTKGTPFVSVMVTDPQLKQRLEQHSDQVIEVLGLRQGVTHLECFVKADGEIVFCEVAVRPGGGGIVLMLEKQYGIHYGRAALLLEGGRGELVQLQAPQSDAVAALIGFRLDSAGFVQRIATPDHFAEDWIHHVDISAAPGSFVARAGHCTDFVGLLIFSSQDRPQFERKHIELHQRFNAQLEIQPA